MWMGLIVLDVASVELAVFGPRGVSTSRPWRKIGCRTLH
ncbi:Hypothetical protein A7982_07144 [Minicystis rosea]|nr:Hypothetical protein A7982_07144 [Minicystis rosea]